jgi:hypothetical protein
MLLAIAVCAFAGLLGGIGYAALTAPPFTAKAEIVLRPGTAVPGLGQAGVQRLTSRVVSVSAQGDTAAQAVSADTTAVRSYLARAEGAQLVSYPWPVPRHDGGRRSALAALGALVGVLAGAIGARAGRRAILV